IFDAIAPAASAGLARLSAGDLQGFHGILEPTVPLSRHIFQAPTRFYKTGVVFLAWLNALQDHFIMVGAQESARSLRHLAHLFPLADTERVWHAPELRAARMNLLLAVHGLASIPTRCRSISRPCARSGICTKRSKPACGTALELWTRGATRSPPSVSMNRCGSLRAMACG